MPLAQRFPYPMVVLTGAGISAESGVPTFRAADGLWENHRIEDVATPEAFARDPQQVHRFYNERRRLLRECAPNRAHRSLADFARQGVHAGELLLITQNIDDLHERAGSPQVLHMHGELGLLRCTRSGRCFPAQERSSVDDVCPCCQQSGTLRPHVVWFGETPFGLEHIYTTLQHCRLFLSIGTSSNVYPAADFVHEARHAGARCVELNLVATAKETLFHEGYYGRATEVVPAFLATLDEHSEHHAP